MRQYSNKVRKRISFILVAFILFYNISSIIMPVKVYAAQERKEYTGLNEAKYPGYNALISELKNIYPNATFTIHYTGLDWAQVIANEALGHPTSPRNLIGNNKTGAWICSSCGTKGYDNGSWCCASEYAIAYYMDPRNWLNSTYIFEFEDVRFIEDIHTTDGIKNMTAGTFLAGDSIAKAIYDACESVGISPYYVVSRIKQEQGSSGSSTAKGKYPGYEGYYNVFNVNATGKGSDTIIKNALSYAKEQGWDTLEKSILGGIGFLKSKYVDRGQNTLYLNKFDIDSSDGTLYTHQYMQNIQAPVNEAYSVYKVYNNTEKRTYGAFNFIIPVYENMPIAISSEPTNSEITPINVKTTGTNIILRNSTSTGSSKIGKVAEKGTILLSIERTEYINGYYWDKVVLPDGTVGYMASTYLEEIDTVQTCSKTAVVNGNGVNVRNGPGTTGTIVITSLAQGTGVTIIDEACYNIDGMTWDRIILADGRQAFIASKYLKEGTSEVLTEIVQINGTGVRLRAEAGTSGTEILKFENGTTLTRIEKGTELINGYYWDKVTTVEGITGYVATDYLVPVNNNFIPEVPENPEETDKPTNTENEIYKIDETSKILTTIPDTEIGNIPNATGTLATGSKVTINGVEYTVVKMGDVNGDGVADALDALQVLKHDTKLVNLNGVYLNASDVNNDLVVDSLDALQVLKYDVGMTKINM